MSKNDTLEDYLLKRMESWTPSSLRYALAGHIANQKYLPCDLAKERKLELGLKAIFNKRGIPLPEFTDEEMKASVKAELIVRSLKTQQTLSLHY